jgi:hypothetical protein
MASVCIAVVSLCVLCLSALIAAETSAHMAIVFYVAGGVLIASSGMALALYRSVCAHCDEVL